MTRIFLRYTFGIYYFRPHHRLPHIFISFFIHKMAEGDKVETTKTKTTQPPGSGSTSRTGQIVNRNQKIGQHGHISEIMPRPTTVDEGLAWFNAFKKETDAHIAKYTTTDEDKREWAAIKKMEPEEVLVQLKKVDKSLLKLTKELQDQEKDLELDLDNCTEAELRAAIADLESDNSDSDDDVPP